MADTRHCCRHVFIGLPPFTSYLGAAGKHARGWTLDTDAATFDL